ncbi:hypothetical protein GYMLUDRAFT_868852 [Collybiopsis luxurians FD-317 M1]|nr:hypothetical protein GYMLUDRAFT_868852 [Collybiopsis luxurians FD-317 M1]
MPKRSAPKASEESDSKSSTPPRISVKKPKIAMEEDDSSASSSEAEKPKVKAKAKAKGKGKDKEKPSSTTAPSMKKNSEGDHYIDLGKNKRATVRTFKGSTGVDIREYYGNSESDMKPGKKGIYLTVEQWEALKNAQVSIDGAVAGEQKK